MDAQTKSEIIETVTSTAAAIGKEMLVRRQDEKRLETRAEYEKEIAEAREQAAQAGAKTAGSVEKETAQQPAQQAQQAAQQPAQQADPEPEPEPSKRGRDRSQQPSGDTIDIDALAENEDCEMCTAILQKIRTLDPDKRAIALADYGRMKRAMEDEGTEEAVRAVVDDSPVLGDVMESIV